MTIKLKDAEARRIADLLTRIVPKGETEGVEILSYVKRLQGSR